MVAYSWPGNVRELRNIVERMLVLHRKEPVILADHLPEEFHTGSSPMHSPDDADEGTLAGLVGNYERQLIEKALKDSGGVQTRAAVLLGTTRRILRYRMDKLGLGSDATEPDGED